MVSVSFATKVMADARLRRMTKFAIVGAINTGIDVGVFSLLYFWVGLPVLVPRLGQWRVIPHLCWELLTWLRSSFSL